MRLWLPSLYDRVHKPSGSTSLTALFRHTLYAELSSPRQVRLHRQIAEEMERFWGERVSEHARGSGVPLFAQRRSSGCGTRCRSCHYSGGSGRGELTPMMRW